MIRTLYLTLLFGALTLCGCTTMSYSSSNTGGRLKQTACAQGQCHTLYGFGHIYYDRTSDILTISCNGRPTQTFRSEDVPAYDCYTGTIVSE